MRILRLYRLLIPLLVLVSPAFPGIRPSFNLDVSSWDATHIVLVVTTPTDGTFEVVESWKGDLRAGQQLVIPELRPDLNAIPISKYPDLQNQFPSGGISESIPRQPVGSRMILFLKCDKTAPCTWKAATFWDSMKVSVVWIDEDQTYFFFQPMNPGPSVLARSPFSERRIRDRVIEIDGLQKSITQLLATTEGAGRAEKLKPYLQSDIVSVRLFALQELSKSQAADVSTILGMLDDPPFARDARELVMTLIKIEGDAAGPELNRRLQQNLTFWKSKAPSLSQNWWNQDPTPRAPLRERYTLTFDLIMGLEQTHYPPSLDTATQLRDFWRSLPQLNDPSGLNQMANECDKLIAQLQTNPQQN